MKAIRVHRFGPPEVMILEEVPQPQPGAGQVLVRVRAAGLNYADLVLREGLFPAAVSLPYTPGHDVVGTVEALAAEVTDLAVGARVVAMLAMGAYAEYVAVPAAAVRVVPEGIDDETALALPLQGITAMLALRFAGRVEQGNAVFVPAAAGGVGSLAVQLAKCLGAARVIAGASTQEKRALALRLGADAAIDYTEDGWANQVLDATEGRGADVVLEMNGGPMADESLRALAPGGRLVVFGADSVRAPRLDAAQLRGLIARGQAYVGCSFAAAPESVRRAALDELFAAAVAGEIRANRGEKFPLARAAEAHRALASRKARGKLALVP